MSNIAVNIRRIGLLFLCLIFGVFLMTGCGAKTSSEEVQTDSEQETPADTPADSQTDIPESAPIRDIQDDDVALRDTTPQVLPTVTAGEGAFTADIAVIDTTNAADGYIVLTYTGTNEKVKFQIGGPDEVTCTYLVSEYHAPIVYPLTGGNGAYTFTLLEALDAVNNKYYIAASHAEDVTLNDELAPFLTPNVYVNFTEDSASVAKGVELAEGCHTDLNVIENIYHHVTTNVTYDTEKAKSVPYGYIPVPDETLSAGKGICFDYASLMTAMLRSQRIPTRLEVGYAGEIYHAWISCYVAEIGWVDNIIEFNGENWSLMDPTLAANNSSGAVQEYIGDGSTYVVKYTY